MSVIIGDYEYGAFDGSKAWVQVVDRTKSSYEAIRTSVMIDGVLCTVSSMEECFADCVNMTSAPNVTNVITNMDWAFAGCTTLRRPPTLGNNVKTMNSCFRDCTTITRTPFAFPSRITHMNDCFRGCTSLTEAEPLPPNVTAVNNCFRDCTSLQTAPKIPSSATYISGCFQGCTALEGDVRFMCSGTVTAANVFTGTTKPIVLYTYASNANAIKGSAANVTFANIKIDPLHSEVVKYYKSPTELGEVRVDMLVDCTQGRYIVDAFGTLYDMDDNPISIGENVAQPDYLRCYTIISTSSQVGGRGSVMLKTIAPSLSATYASIGFPSTATPSQIKQQGQTKPISPQIHCSDVRFNSQTLPTNAAKGTVGDFIGQFGYGSASNKMSKVQTNVDGSVRHVITHADNVVIDDSRHTLQDWITEQYNNLT